MSEQRNIFTIYYNVYVLSTHSVHILFYNKVQAILGVLAVWMDASTK